MTVHPHPHVRESGAVARPRRSGTARDGAHVAAMQRRRLILAFTEILGESGLESAGVGRICARASVSRRTFYEIFTDREACFLAAFDLAIEQFASRVVPAYRCDGRWHERVREALGLLLESFDREPLLAWLCIVEAPKGGSRVLRRRGEVIDALVGAVDEGRSGSRVSPSPLTAESVVGGVLSILQDRLLNGETADSDSRGGDARNGLSWQRVRCVLAGLPGPLTSMILQPYLGVAAAKRELARTAHRRHAKSTGERADADSGFGDGKSVDPFRGLSIRVTYRTARVMSVIADSPGASNRKIAEGSGAADQGQISKLLHRLELNELIVNHGRGRAMGERNSWSLTPRGQAIHRALQGPAPTPAK